MRHERGCEAGARESDGSGRAEAAQTESHHGATRKRGEGAGADSATARNDRRACSGGSPKRYQDYRINYILSYYLLLTTYYSMLDVGYFFEQLVDGFLWEVVAADVDGFEAGQFEEVGREESEAAKGDTEAFEFLPIFDVGR